MDAQFSSQMKEYVCAQLHINQTKNIEMYDSKKCSIYIQP